MIDYSKLAFPKPIPKINKNKPINKISKKKQDRLNSYSEKDEGYFNIGIERINNILNNL